MKKNMLSLPRELLLEILLRLPVKSLLRFRCVSKLWLSLISDPHFARSHFELAYARTHRIMLLKSSFPETRSIDLDASLHDDSASVDINLSFPFGAPFYNVQMIGSCRGFLILWDQSSYFHMWNPSTGVHKQVPLSPITFGPDYFANPYLYGFGYDPSTDDYLVVVASYDLNVVVCETHFEYFSLRANSWKKIEGTHLPYMNSRVEPRVGPFLNGAIHCLACRHDDAVSMNVIFAFDLVERSFSEIPLPNDLVFDFDFDELRDLWVHGGLLSLWIHGVDGVEIWVMEEYKVESSWTKSIVVPYDYIPTRYLSPICSTKCGDTFGMDGDGGLVKCNAKGEVLEHRSSYSHGDEDEGEDILGAAMYVESLLSLPYAQDE